ncbi:N-6 DNA methylase [Streptomyces sp. ITFR-6]|uniref:N-6 DNA methylase n=1 Tax=Streptomyces sp. ITFR-6 TaxID=3075197 RepID=UPI00288B645A|nr:N-6 DNA methylase [Streptomyces sp. ITFR-6]WNI30831.1 N-6 DNA methylase [Streptomyces sp. ITFR-6]
MSDTGALRRRVQAEDPLSLDEVLLKVQVHRKYLSRLMNAHDATRLVLGLLFLSRKAHAAPGTGVPTWSWLLGQPAAGGSGIRAAVSKCLAHWLPTTDAQGIDAGTRSLIPIPPPRSDEHLHALIQAIGSTQRVGPLLDQCLRDLSADQAGGSHYFTPVDMARLMVGAAVPRDRHRVLDPVCGSGGLLVESHRYVHDRVEVDPAMSLQGREQHAYTSQVARMNFAVRGISADVSPPGDSLAEPEREPHDIILANLPFNQRDWAPEARTEQSTRRPASLVNADPRWPEEPPPRGSANSAWIQHIAHALAPAGRAAFLMADTVANTRQPITRRLRERLLRDDLVECVIALPPRVFGHTQTTACLWVLNKDKSARPGWGIRDRRRQVLFINARRAFEQIPDSRARRLGEMNAALILETLAAWRGLSEHGVAATPYKDETGWSRSCSTEEIAGHEYSLMPTSYAVEPPSPERDTRSRIDELKLELADSFDRMRDLEIRLLDALEEI